MTENLPPVVVFFLELYIVVGLVFLCYLVTKESITKLTRGDVILAIILLPFTLIVLAYTGVSYLLAFIINKLEASALRTWWTKPVIEPSTKNQPDNNN